MAVAHFLAGDGSDADKAHQRRRPGRLGMGLVVALVLGLLAPLGTAVPVSAQSTVGDGWAWGNNFFGQLGNGGNTSSSTPVAVSMPEGTTFTAVSTHAHHSLALDTTGRAWAWGLNNSGELGNGSTDRSSTPVAVSMPEGTTFTAVSMGAFHSLALDTTGRAWAWGSNRHGQLGKGDTSPSSTPVAVNMPEGVTFTAVSAGVMHSLALDTAGQVWAWGYNLDGELGNGSTNPSSTPVRVNMPEGVTFTAVAAGDFHSLALDATGRAWAWGAGSWGQLGNGSTNEINSTPVAVSMPEGTTFTTISGGFGHNLALDATGRAWAWGLNNRGQLGNGSNVNSSMPVAVTMPEGVTFTAVSAGTGHNLALDATGRAWAWGFNEHGRLGDGSTNDTSTPVAVTMPEGVTFTAVSAGTDHSLALSGMPEATPSPTDISFPDQELGTTGEPQTVTVKNTGTANLTISNVGMAGDNPGDFTATSDTCTGATIPPGRTCTIAVVFSPTATGRRSASLVITHNAGSTTVALTGTGTTAAPEADLDVRLTAPSKAPMKRTYTYTYTLTNNGPDTARDIVATITSPTSLRVVDSAPTPADTTRTQVRWQAGSLDSGESQTFTIRVKPLRPGTVTATAEATSRTTDPRSGNNAATVRTHVTRCTPGLVDRRELSLGAPPAPICSGCCRASNGRTAGS